MPRKFNINSRTITAPLAAFCMASILFVYARTSIQAAKRNAQKHREADGGQISWRNESLRQHGALERPEQQGPVKQLLLGGGGIGAAGKGKKAELVPGSEKGEGRSEAEEKVREVVREKGRRDG